MICPKCGAQQQEEKSECTRCGVIFAKLTPEDFAPLSSETEDWEDPPSTADGKRHRLRIYLFGTDVEEKQNG